MITDAKARDRLVYAEAAYMLCSALHGWVKDVLEVLEDIVATKARHSSDAETKLDAIVQLEMQRQGWIQHHCLQGLGINTQRSFFTSIQSLARTFLDTIDIDEQCVFTLFENATGTSESNQCQMKGGHTIAMTRAHQRLWYTTDLPLKIESVSVRMDRVMDDNGNRKQNSWWNSSSDIGIVAFNDTLWDDNAFPVRPSALRRAHTQMHNVDASRTFPFFF